MPTTSTNATPDTYTTTLSDLSTAASRPDDRSGGLDLLVEAAYAARVAYDDIDWQCDHADDGSDVKTILRRARETAYDTWQAIERAGLPLLQRWQRETLGYSESEIAEAHPARCRNCNWLGYATASDCPDCGAVALMSVPAAEIQAEIEAEDEANGAAEANGLATPYPSEY